MSLESLPERSSEKSFVEKAQEIVTLLRQKRFSPPTIAEDREEYFTLARKLYELLEEIKNSDIVDADLPGHWDRISKAVGVPEEELSTYIQRMRQYGEQFNLSPFVTQLPETPKEQEDTEQDWLK